MKSFLNKTSLKFLLQFLVILGASFVIIIVASNFNVGNEPASTEVAVPLEE